MNTCRELTNRGPRELGLYREKQRFSMNSNQCAMKCDTRSRTLQDFWQSNALSFSKKSSNFRD